MFTRKRIRTTLVLLPGLRGRAERLKWHNLPRAKQLQQGSTSGQEASRIFRLLNHFPSQMPMTRETEDFRALGHHHLVKNRHAPTKSLPVTHQFGNSIRHHRR